MVSGERKDKSERRYFDKISLKKEEEKRKEYGKVRGGFLSLINWTKMGKFGGGSGEKREKERKEERKEKKEERK